MSAPSSARQVPLGLVVFDHLCAVGNALETLREETVTGSDAWCGLTELLQQIDHAIDMLVHSAPLED